MNFNDIKTFTYIGNTVSIEGETREVEISLNPELTAVQYHQGRDYLLEEPLMTKAPLNKYQYAIDEWVSSEVIPLTLEEQYTKDPFNVIKEEVQKYLDNRAKALGYDDINTISKFMGFDNSFRASAEALALLTANIWKYIEDSLEAVEAGTLILPETIEEVMAGLPTE